MVSVTRENIGSLFPEIEVNITRAAFVCIDTEFSGLSLGGTDARESRFDTAGDRYDRYRRNIRDASLLQLGIACFIDRSHEPPDNGGGGDADNEHLDDETSYKVVCYNILLAPADLGLVAFRPRVLMAEWPALRFLSSHGFDLNQVVRNGVSYLRVADVERLAKFLSPGICALKETEFDTDAVRTADRELQQIQKIVEKSGEGLDHWDFDNLKSVPLALHWLVREDFPYMWTRPNAWDSMQAEHVHDDRIKLEKSDRVLESWIVKETSFAGRIFTTLVEQRKLVVGYQIIQDILFLIDAFYSPLPEQYADIKLLLQELFPNLYDVKVIVQALSRIEAINLVRHFDPPGLQETFEILTGEKSAGMFKYAPQVQHDTRHTFYAWEDHAHEAAYDAFMTGTVFIDCIFAINADIVATERVKLTQKPAENPETRYPVKDTFQKDGSQTCHALPPLLLRQVPSDIQAVAPYRGTLMLHMAADKHINILGDDPQAERSKTCVLLSTPPKDSPVADNLALMAYLESSVYEFRRMSEQEIIVACASLDRAKAFAEYCRRTFEVDAAVQSSHDPQIKLSEKPPKLPVVLCGVLFTAILGYICQKIALNR